MVMKPTNDSIIDSINGYLEVLPEEQHQEVLNFTQSLLTVTLRNKIKSLPADKQCEVLDFVEYLIEEVEDKNLRSSSEFWCQGGL